MDKESETSDIDTATKEEEKKEELSEERKAPDSSRGGAKNSAKPPAGGNVPTLKLKTNELIQRHEMVL